MLGLERERCSRAYCLGRLLRDALRRRVCPQRPLEGLAEVPRGSKAILDELPGTQNRSPEAHIGVEICWSGTTGIEHSAHAARFQPIVAILHPRAESCSSSPLAGGDSTSFTKCHFSRIRICRESRCFGTDSARGRKRLTPARCARCFLWIRICRESRCI